MALSSVSFVEGQGGLGRPIDSKDHYSGLAFYNVSTLPSGFSNTSNATRCKLLYSVDDAIAAGIKKDYSDATAAQGVYTFTAVGADGDTVEIKIADFVPTTGAAQSTSLGVYTKTAADTTVTLLATAYKNLINAGTNTHGYSATSSVGAVTIIAPKSMGAGLNGATALSATIVGTIAGTITSQIGTSVAGVASKFAQYYYQISEFFRMQPKGFLWVGFFGTPSTYTELTDMQVNAGTNGASIRQLAVWKDGTWASADITYLQAIGTACKALYQPLSFVYGANLVATTDITTAVDVSTLSANLVSSCISQCASGLGNFIYKTSGGATKISIPNIGTMLGAIALRKVSESIAYVGKTNLSNGTENELIAFCNGQLYTSFSANQLTALDTKGHVFMLKYPSYTGSFFNSSRTCITTTSDYATIELNRTICKAERNLYAKMVPYLSSPIGFNSNGTIQDTFIAMFENEAISGLDQMVKDSELSQRQVVINPTQNTLSTSTLTISVTLVPYGVARFIVINIGFKTSIS